MSHALARSYAYCDRLARRKAGNFYHAFRVLPRAQRQAMCALYAFMRHTDDLGDGPGSSAEKRDWLRGWRGRFRDALADAPSHRLHLALKHTIDTYRIPPDYVEAVVDGVEMDLDRVHYATFADLYRYCWRVASAVGLACIHIWGFSDDAAKQYAEKAGIAFQLTNILRDLSEDAGRGRVYLPREDLDRFGYGEAEISRGVVDDRFRRLMSFEVGRVRQYYDAAMPLAGMLPAAGRAVFLVMTRTYRGLLDAIEEQGYDVFRRRIRLSPWRKLRLVAGALPVRWGWA